MLRRILRRAVRHAWLLGRKRADARRRRADGDRHDGRRLSRSCAQRAQHIVETTRVEEQRFLATIEGGLARFEQLAPAHTTQAAPTMRGTISGEDAFRLYDTFGFPIDLTELMARERGYTVDIAGLRGGARRAAHAVAGRAEVAASSASARTRSATARSGSADGRERARARRSSATTRSRSTRRSTAIDALDDGRVAVLLREIAVLRRVGRPDLRSRRDRRRGLARRRRRRAKDRRPYRRRSARSTGEFHVRAARRARVPTRSAPRHGAQSHGDAPAARGAAPGARRARAPGGLARRAGPAAFRLHSSRSGQARSSSPRSRRS